MKKLKTVVVGLSLLSLAGAAFAVTKDEELAAAKATYTASATTIKTNYAAQIDPLKAQIADLTAQKSTYTQAKKDVANSRKTSRATIQADMKTRRQTECKDPKTADKEAAKTVYYTAKTDCGTQYAKYLGKDADGNNISNPDYTTCIDTAKTTRDAEYTRITGVYETCINGLNTEKQTAYNDLDASLGWTDAVNQLATLNAQVAPLREQVGALKDAMSAELETLKTAYDEAVAAIEVKYAETVPTPEPTACVDSTWEPSNETISSQDKITQTSNCGNTRIVYGACVDSIYTPDNFSMGPGRYYQTSNCGVTRLCSNYYAVDEKFGCALVASCNDGYTSMQQADPSRCGL